MFTLALVRFPPTATKEIQYLNVFFSSRRRHTRLQGDWSSDVCSSDLIPSLSGRGRFSPRPSGDTVSTAGGGSSTGGRGSSLLLILFCTAWLARSTTPLMPEARPSTTFCWKFGSDRKSTRLNSSHLVISYAVFCLKKKNKPNHLGFVNVKIPSLPMPTQKR